MSEQGLGNFYCSEKFTWLSVDLEKRQIFSCCAARPEQVNVNWVKLNPGQLFNTPLLQQERQQMLSNHSVDSCEDVCWKLERQNLTSRRQMLGSDVCTHTDIKVKEPKKLNIVLGSTCNLTCSYCCKNYSSAWYRDIVEHGPYLDQERFTLTTRDKLLANISHNEHQESSGFQTLLAEIQNFSEVEEIYVTGGEPFLYNALPDLLNKLVTTNNKIICYTGLGVDSKRFKSQLVKIQQRPNIKITVSGETCNEFYEFNRYGNSWNNFVDNLTHLKTQGFDYDFSSVLSNLTVFGLMEFVELFTDNTIKYQFCSVPDFLNVNVLDDISKKQLIEVFANSNLLFKDQLIDSMSKPCTDLQRDQLSLYVKEFAKRRNLNLDIYPKNFTNWIGE
jgi:organic radical activating enzyme